MIALHVLEAKFQRVQRPGFWEEVATIAEAQGVRFLCPKCFAINRGKVGTHSVICWSRSRGTPEDEMPGPGRWKLDGTSIADLTLNADPPSSARSVQLHGGCAWHGFITNGYAHGDIPDAIAAMLSPPAVAWEVTTGRPPEDDGRRG